MIGYISLNNPRNKDKEYLKLKDNICTTLDESKSLKNNNELQKALLNFLLYLYNKQQRISYI